MRSLDEACEHVEALLRRAVKEHLESDVPVATFLSGGIDSSLVTAYANEMSPAPIKAYSIGFQRDALRRVAVRAADRRRSIGVPISSRDVRRGRRRARSSPTRSSRTTSRSATPRASPRTCCRQHVARDYKVALGGDGGDEVFAGYKKYLVVHLRRPFAAAPRAARRARHARSGRTAADPSRPHARVDRGAAHSCAASRAALDGTDAHVYAQLTPVWRRSRAPQPLMRAAGRPPRASRRKRRRGSSAAAAPSCSKSLAADLGSMLCNDMLVKVDRASMACSLEARVPFLDHRVVEFGVGLPERLHARAELAQPFSGKRVLRALHERRFGPELAHRKKQGFGVPVEKWLRGPFDDACERLFDEERLDRYGILSSDELSDGGFRRWLRATDPLSPGMRSRWRRGARRHWATAPTRSASCHRTRG